MFTMTEELREKIERAVIEAELDACNNTSCHFAVYLDEDGELDTYYDVAGSNMRPRCLYYGTGLLLYDICYEYSEPFLVQMTSDEIIAEMKRNHPDIAGELGRKIEELKEENEYFGTRELEEEFPELFDEVREDFYDWFKSCLRVTVYDDFEVEVEFDN